MSTPLPSTLPGRGLWVLGIGGTRALVLYLLPTPALPAAPLAPLLVNVTSEGPSQLLAVWAHAPGGRDSYQVTLYQAGVRASTRALGAEVNCTSFWALIPGTKYEVEIVSWAGPLRAAAANVSGWTCE